MKEELGKDGERGWQENMLLLDTNIFIDYFREYKPSIDFFNNIKDKMIIFSAITEAELIAGKACNDKSKREVVIGFLNKWKKIEVNNPIAVLAGDICRNNDNIETADAIIAATAIINKAELLTKNVKHFDKIEGLRVRSPY